MPNRVAASSGRRPPRALLVITMIGAATIATLAQPGDRLSQLTELERNPNFDVRIDEKFAPPGYLEKVAAGVPDARGDALRGVRARGMARLLQTYPNLQLENNEAVGTPEIVGVTGGGAFLTGPGANRVTTMRGFLTAFADAYGVTDAEVSALSVVIDEMNPAGNMGWVELEQTINGLPVFRGHIRGGFTARGELVRVNGTLASGIDPAALPTEPAVSATDAIVRAAASVGWPVEGTELAPRPANAAGHSRFAAPSMADDPTAWLLYMPFGPGVARLAWATEIIGDPIGYLVVVDAEDGSIIFRKNLTNFQTQAATYNVYTSDSPAPSSPTTALPGAGTQFPVVSRTSVTLIGNEAPNSFNNLGWISDGTNGVNGHTDGNNVEAGMDVAAPNGVDAPVSGAARVFNFAYNPAPGSPAPGDAPSLAGFRNGEAVNMFYWTNVFHDRLYLLGFTEGFRNFQNDNFGRGGVGSDRISAEGQDSSGNNNANFTTFGDGVRGRMQMYVFTTTAGEVDRSSGLDQEIMLHELTHGLSNRLIGNATGLNNNQGGSLGEGWSDFYARALLSTAGEDVNGIFATGGWATFKFVATNTFTDNYYYGIRRFPYAVRTTTGGPLNRPHNPLTFADIDPAQIDISDGAFAPTPLAFIANGAANEVHNAGELWCMALLEVRARLITRLGFAVGNDKALQFVTDGMKLTPSSPTMVQARSAIVAAAQAAGTAADVADVWAGFAARGLGVMAVASNATTAVTESFLTPSDPVPTLTVDDVAIVEGNAGTSNAVFTVTLTGGGALETRVTVATADGTATRPPATTLTNPSAITINDNAAATPYPMTVNVAGMTGTIANVAVRLNGLTHSFPSDVDLLLVGPGGQQSLFLSDAGGGGDVSSIDLTFEDGAPAASTTQLTTGTFAPTNVDTTTDALPLPAPPPAAGEYNVPLSIFNGTSPNGTWSIYARDDTPTDAGSISGGVSLLITTTTAAGGDYLRAAGQLVFPSGTTTRTVTVPIFGDVTPEPTETFFVNLTAPVNGVIGDNQAVGTIINDDGGGTLPTTTDDAFTTPLNAPLSVAAPGVLANDNSNGGGTLSAGLATGPAHGTLSLAADGGFLYSPATGYAGPDSFTYFAVNSFGAGNTATVSVAVGGLLPTTVSDTFATPYPAALTVAAPGVLANDHANGGGAMTAALVSDVSNGTLILGGDGSVSYTPNLGFVGTETFAYRAVNAAGGGNVATVTIAVTPPTSVQAPYNLRVDSVVGNTVTLRFDTLPIGPQAANFVLRGGLAPGQVLASIPTGGPSPIFTFVAPTGSFFIRLHGQLGSDESPASNEVPLHVNVPVTPSAPARLTGLVNGAALELTWKNTFDGGPPTATVLDVTGSFVGSLPLGPIERFSFNPVPGGSYTFRVRETSAGGSSAPSDPVTLTFPGACSGPPNMPENFLGYRVGSTGYAIWDPPAAGPAPTSYLLDVTGSFVGAFGTAGRALSGAIGAGSYNVRVQSINACGASAFTPVQVITNP